MRWVVVTCLSVALCFAFAGTASSGALGTPFSSDVCAEFNPAGESMADPNGLYSGVGSTDLCEKLCNKATNQCRSYVKKSISCFKHYVQEQLGWNKQNCDVIYDEDPESRKLCKEEAKDSSNESKELIELFHDAGLEECDEWGEDCSSTCLPL